MVVIRPAGSNMLKCKTDEHHVHHVVTGARGAGSRKIVLVPRYCKRLHHRPLHHMTSVCSAKVYYSLQCMKEEQRLHPVTPPANHVSAKHFCLWGA